MDAVLVARDLGEVAREVARVLEDLRERPAVVRDDAVHLARDPREVLDDLAQAPLVASHRLGEIAGHRLDVDGDPRHRVHEALRRRGRPRAHDLALLLRQVGELQGLLRPGGRLEDGVQEERRGVDLREAAVGVRGVVPHPDLEARPRAAEPDLVHLADLDAGDLHAALPGETVASEVRVDEVAVALEPALAEEGERDEERDAGDGGEQALRRALC